MESINNNFKVSSMKKTDWMDCIERSKNQMSWCCVRDCCRMKSKPHSLQRSKMKWRWWKIVQGINTGLLKRLCSDVLQTMGAGKEMKYREVHRCISNPKDMLFLLQEIYLTIHNFFNPFCFVAFLPCFPCAMILKRYFFSTGLIVIIIRYVLAH